MKKLGLAAGLLERDERRGWDRREFSYTAFLPDRRVRSDRRCIIPIHLVVLEDEEIASLLEFSNEL